MKSWIMSHFGAYLLWIELFSHQTTHTCNATYINFHFKLLKFADDKMIEDKINNDLNLSGEFKIAHK